jgi:hypothetical protein
MHKSGLMHQDLKIKESLKVGKVVPIGKINVLHVELLYLNFVSER